MFIKSKSHCYHAFLCYWDRYLFKKFSESYSAQMVLTDPSGSWTFYPTGCLGPACPQTHTPRSTLQQNLQKPPLKNPGHALALYLDASLCSILVQKIQGNWIMHLSFSCSNSL